MENNPNVNWQSYESGRMSPMEQLTFPIGKREVIFGGLVLLCCFALRNFTLFGGFNLGFAAAVILCILCSCGYLLSVGCRPSGYSCCLLGLSMIIAAAFARTNDGFVKFVMLCFLLVSINLGLCLMAQQNLHNPGTVTSLLDAPRALFQLGVGRSPEVFRGLTQAFRRSGSVGQKGGAFVLGICIAVPILAVMIPLLISADAAFDGLITLLPEFDLHELFATVFFGIPVTCVLFVRGVALRHSPKESKKEANHKGLHAITVNTVLVAVCLLFLVYLLSQLAYFVGGFAGILPEQYTLAEYARRGFFEMAALCVVNLAVIVLSLGLIHKNDRAPLFTRLLCLFIGLVTLFLVATASAKMFLYIGSYGLTRLRVLTQIIMLFLALTTGVLILWLFMPKLPYMKIILLTALIIGTVTIWTDVNTQVAQYNVDAYLSGQLDHVDVVYLKQLGDSAVPQIARLATSAPDQQIVNDARNYLRLYNNKAEDFRSWNYVNHIAQQYLPQNTAQAHTTVEE